MALAASDAGDRVEQLIVLTERLTDLIAGEAEALDAGRNLQVAASVEETARLANLYRHESMRVRQDPALVGEAPLEQRLRLMRATEAFDGVLARHARVVESVKTITEGVVRTVAVEISSARTAAAGYGPGARAPAPAAAAAATAITLNRRA